MPQPYDVEPFRARYRAGISPYYNAWLHGGFVFAAGLAVVAFFLSRLHDVRPLEWLALPVGVLFFSWGEYTTHRELGHKKRRFAALFYQRHTGDHHSFFVEGRMRYETPQDWRVIFFPAWLIVAFTVFLALPAWWLVGHWSGNAGALFAATLIGGYITYEFFHACEHLPADHPLARLPWIQQMRVHHARHHRRELMQTHNFNLVLPLVDWLRGTWYREPEKKKARS